MIENCDILSIRKAMIAIVLFAIMIFSFLWLNARTRSTVDSLKAELQKASSDLTKISLLTHLAQHVYQDKPLTAIQYGNQAIVLSKSLNNNLLLAEAYRIVGVAYGIMADYPNALNSFYQSIEVYKKLNEPSKAAKVYNNIGIVYMSQKDYEKAFQYTNLAIHIHDSIKTKESLASKAASLVSLGIIQSALNKTDDAIVSYRKALRIQDSLDITYGYAIILHNLSNAYLKQKKYDKVLETVNKSLEINSQKNSKMGLAYDFSILGAVHSAIYSEEITRGKNNTDNLLKSIEYYNKSLRYSRAINLNQITITNYKALHIAYKHLKEFEKAEEYLSKHYELKDSIFSSEKARELANLTAIRENESKENRIALLMKEKQADNYRILFFAVLTAFLALAIAVIYFYMKKKRRLSEEMLNKLLSAVEQSDNHIFITDVEGNIEYVNKKFTEVTGYSKEEVIGKNPRFLKSGLYRDEDYDELWDTILKGKTWNSEIINKKKSGELYWEKNVITPVFDKKGKLVNFIAIKEDISERKKTEEAIIESERFRKRVFESSCLPIVIMDAESYRFVDCNHSAVKIYGYGTKEETLNKTPLDVSAEYQYDGSPSKEKAVYNINLALSYGSYTFYWKHLRPNGEIWDAEVHLMAFNDIDKKFLQFSLIDITARKQAELQREFAQEQLKASEEKYRSIFLNLQIGLLRTDIKTGNVIDGNETVAQFFGFPNREALLANQASAIERYADPNDRERMISALKERGELRDYEIAIREIDGSIGWIRISSKLDLKGRFIDTMTEDITERKKAELALKESEERFRSIFENSTIGLYRTTPDGKIIMANPTIVEMMGYNSFEELTELDLEDEEYSKFSNRELYLKELDEKGEIKGVEFPWRRRDGKTIYVRESAKVVKNDDGSVKYFEGTVEDISERKAIEVELYKSEELYRKLLYTVPDLIIQTDIDGNILFVNETAFSTLSFLPKENIHGKNIFSFISDKDKQRAYENTKLMFEAPLGIKEYLLVFEDGAEIECEVNGDVIRDANEQPVGMVYVVRDITERKRTEEELINSRRLILQEQKFNRLLLDTSPAFIVALDFQGHILMMNKAMLDVLGYAIEEVRGADYLFTIVPEEDRKRVADIFTNIIAKGVSTINESRIVGRAGVQYLVQWYGNVAIRDGGNSFFVGIGIDITDQKKAESALKESEEKYRLLFESANDAIFLMKKDLFIACNQKTFDLFGCNERDIINAHPAKLSPDFQPDGRISAEKANEKISAALSGEPQFFEWIHKKFDGEHFYAEVSLNRIELSSDIFIQAIVRDISQRKKAEIALRESEERFRNLTNLLPQTVFEIDLFGNFTFVNMKALEVYGYSIEDFSGGLNCFDMFLTEERFRLLYNFTKSINKKGAIVSELTALRKDGFTFPVMVFFNAIMNEETPVGFRGIVIDMSEIKKAENALIKAKEKAEESDRLKSAFLANISHEIRTPINGIVGFLKLLSDPDLTEEERNEYIAIVNASCQRLINTMNDIIEISLIDSGLANLQISEFNVYEILQLAYDFNEQSAYDKGLSFSLVCGSFEEVLLLRSDRTILLKILSNTKLRSNIENIF